MLPPHQDGVVSRSQLLAAGWSPHDVRRLLRRRELRSVAPGVYVDHTGPLTWRQRAWAAVLWAWPAALCGESALAATQDSSQREHGPIHVAIDHGRRLTAAPVGIIVTRMREFEPRVHWHLSPPRLAYDEAVLDVASGTSRVVDQVAVLAGAVGARRTTAVRLRARLDARPRVPYRHRIERLLADIESGTHSVLEHGYLVHVERPHGLPAGTRQAREVADGVVRYRDVEVADRIVIELDGRLHHDSAHGRDRDLDRDLDAAVSRRQTIRLGWGQVFDRPCRTAARLAALFTAAGWTGTAEPCGPACPVGPSSGSAEVTT